MFIDTPRLTSSFKMKPQGEYTNTYDSMADAMIASVDVEAHTAPYAWLKVIPVRIKDKRPGFHVGEKWGLDIIDLDNLTTLGSV